MARVLRKNIWFSIPVPKIKFDPSPQGKMLWCLYFRSCIKSINLDRCRNFIKKFNFVSTPWKIIIPIAHSPPYHPLNTSSPMPPPTLPPPPTTSLTSTPLTPTPTHPTNTTPPTPPPPNHPYPTTIHPLLHHPQTHHPHPTSYSTTPTPPTEKNWGLNA